MSLDFSRRAHTPELMDTAHCEFETFRDCLADLERVNVLTLAYRPTIAFLDRLASDDRLPRHRPIRILDVGSGYGDMLRRIDRWGRRRALPLDLTGIDLNPWSACAARQASTPDSAITWQTCDLFDFEPAQEVDLIVSSLFAHHLDDSALVRFLTWMERTAGIGWFVNDLHRHPIPYWFFRAASRLMGMHRFVQNDGPVSITRAFVRNDWRILLDRAGIQPGSVHTDWWMPFRLCVSRVQPR
ncbi:methyltransferase [Agaricicola taiwanensis]|uniref:Methyltransferase n=1 Tax=Agaricicola taiwanensis TaxID=591372 RepID=A0A8J2VKX7_9RHOB|nr:methyltransferase domain-containing protein [Agaricicola taiwanensis]GGE29423.1 methyltransferase [Agaricicola taiwanensis]